ncbi:hypothetical protein JJJ17_19190 [Paracoccus caeni]|uniref:Protein ImuA n=1 Tax=Paracoccus caeni TaxID=657651 RepID=A0A934SMY9_9RHOB|nr:hypothetical protein [Paracoccus caeni]MBK4218059.1 hypothetical protein [Paracoccus caeni]
MENQSTPSALALSDVFRLVPNRMHEAEGAGRRGFAVWQALRHAEAPVFWVMPAYQPDLPLLWGIPSALGQRLHLVLVRSETDLLWSVEEVLRAGSAGLVIAEPEKPMSLTAGRRLQLAAERGHTTALMLIRDGAGSNACETRWHCAPRPSDGRVAWHEWRLLKNKRGAGGCWTVAWDGLRETEAVVAVGG